MDSQPFKKQESAIKPAAWGAAFPRERVAPALPTGTVTFLFTDIQGSTPLWEGMPREMQASVAQHHAILREVIEAHGGLVFQIVGDAFQAAFPLAEQALEAGIAVQQALGAARWGATGPLLVRAGIHTGPAELDPIPGPGGAPEYAVSHTLNRAARVMSAGHGGQLLLSEESASLVARRLPDGARLADLGEYRLKGMQQPEHLFQVAAPGLREDFPPLTNPLAYPNNLPPQLTSFIGREQAIAEVTQALAAHRLVTLTGSGGTGKSRLSLEVAGAALERFPDGAWLVELAALADPDLLPATILAVFGLGEQPGRPAAQILQDFVRHKTLLIILDNCEHLIDGCAATAGLLLKASPGLRLLASSREALGVAGELAWKVPSLSLPGRSAPIDLDGLRQSEAVQLFVERARLARPEFDLTGANAPAVAEICLRLDGIPLAIELAAARVRLLAPEQIAARLHDCFRLLTGGSRTALPRQQTLRAAIDWSFTLLNDSERRLFQRLAVFAGGWTLELAEQVCAGEALDPIDILDVLGRLVDKSLVSVRLADSGTRYTLLETIRQYAREKLAVTAEAGWLRDRHMQAMLSLAEAAEPQVRGPDQLAWLDRLEAEVDNLRAAMEWSSTRDPVAFLRIANALFRFFDLRGMGGEGVTWLKKAMEQAPEELSVDRVKAAALASFLLRNLNEFQKAFELAQTAVSQAERLGDPYTLTLAHMVRESAAGFTMHEDIALESQKIGLPLSRALNDPWLTAMFLSGVEWGSAMEIREESIQAAYQAGDGRLVAYCLAGAGYTALFKGDYARAGDYFQEAVATVHQLKDRGGVAVRSIDLANWAEYVEDYALADRLYTSALRIFREAGMPFMIASCLLNRASLALALGNYENFAAQIHEADQVMAEWGGQAEAGVFGHLLNYYKGVRQIQLGDWETARKYFLGMVCVENQNQLQPAGPLLALGLLGLAMLAVEQGQMERGARLFAAQDKMASQNIGFKEKPYELRMRQRYLERAQAALGPERYAACCAEGSALSLEALSAEVMPGGVQPISFAEEQQERVQTEGNDGSR